MQSSTRFHSLTSKFASFSSRRRSSRASSTTSNRSSYSSVSSTASSTMSPTVNAINSVIVRQPSIAGLEEERKSFGSELSILEPRPIVYWGGVEERMGHF